MTYSLQELERIVRAATPVSYVIKGDGGIIITKTLVDFVVAAEKAIPELIAEIRRLDPAYHAAPAPESVSRAQDLMREAAEKRAKLEKALVDAKLGDLRELNAMGLEAELDDDGNLKIRQKPRKGATP